MLDRVSEVPHGAVWTTRKMKSRLRVCACTGIWRRTRLKRCQGDAFGLKAVVRVRVGRGVREGE